MAHRKNRKTANPKKQADLFSGIPIPKPAPGDRKQGVGSDWRAQAMGALRTKLVRGEKLTGQNIRLRLVSEVGEPPHTNAWGPFISYATARGYLTKTPERRMTKLKSSHSRPIPVYIVSI